jgi:hypothetical protein
MGEKRHRSVQRSVNSERVKENKCSVDEAGRPLFRGRKIDLKHYHHTEKVGGSREWGRKYDLRFCIPSCSFQSCPLALAPFAPSLLPRLMGNCSLDMLGITVLDERHGMIIGLKKQSPSAPGHRTERKEHGNGA